VEKAEDGKRLIADAHDGKGSLVGPDDFEQSNDCPHPRAIDQPQARKIDEDLGGAFLTDSVDDWPQVNDRQCIELTLDAENGLILFGVEIEEHGISNRSILRSSY
jgi:hypothetical protein